MMMPSESRSSGEGVKGREGKAHKHAAPEGETRFHHSGYRKSHEVTLENLHIHTYSRVFVKYLNQRRNQCLLPALKVCSLSSHWPSPFSGTLERATRSVTLPLLSLPWPSCGELDAPMTSSDLWIPRPTSVVFTTGISGGLDICWS